MQFICTLCGIGSLIFIKNTFSNSLHVLKDAHKTNSLTFSLEEINVIIMGLNANLVQNIYVPDMFSAIYNSKNLFSNDKLSVAYALFNKSNQFHFLKTITVYED